MARAVYRIDDNSVSHPLTAVKCRDEGKELQRLLELNLDLLPGDQINEDDPRRWLLIRREMPVHDPATGDARWSVDLFLVDQDAVPTLVECKRALDTRSRREVVGQMLDYAANGHFYWTREHLREYAEQTAAGRGVSLEQSLYALGIEDPEETDRFFDRIVENLREGQLRLVFFLEESPYELRSIVDFLNRQTERTEILIVEARQFESDGLRIVVPSVFGYTEQARRIKKSSTASAPARRRWSEEAFFSACRDTHGEAVAADLMGWHEELKGRGYQARLGTGSRRGSISYVLTAGFRRSVATLYTNGELTLNLHWLNDSPQEQEMQHRLVDLLQRAGVDVAPNAFVRMDHEGWWCRRAAILDALGELTDMGGEGRPSMAERAVPVPTREKSA